MRTPCDWHAPFVLEQKHYVKKLVSIFTAIKHSLQVTFALRFPNRMAHDGQRERTCFSNSSNVLNDTRFLCARTSRIALRVCAFGVWLGNEHSASSTILRSCTNCRIIVFMTVVSGTPISRAVFLASSRSFLGVFMVNVVFIPLMVFPVRLSVKSKSLARTTTSRDCSHSPSSFVCAYSAVE